MNQKTSYKGLPMLGVVATVALGAVVVGGVLAAVMVAVVLSEK